MAIHLELAEAMPASRPRADSVHLSLDRVDAAAEPRRLDLRANEATPVRLPEQSVWTIRVGNPELWAPTSTVRVDKASRLHRLTVWPASEITGRLFFFDGNPDTANDLVVRFATPDGASPTISEHSLRCARAREVFSCRVPATVLDLRFRMRGFVSHYRWGTSVPVVSPWNLGTLPMRPGSSLTGWVVIERGPPKSVDTALVTLRPRADLRAATPRTAQQLQRLGMQVRPNGRGFFHFKGVEPGQYDLVAELPGFAPAKVEAVLVLEGLESSLRSVLRLGPPVRLEVAITPPVAPDGKPWIVIADKLDVVGHVDHRIAEHMAAVDGTWRSPALGPGQHRLLVRGSDRSQWHSQLFDPATEGQPLLVDIDSLAVEGEVRLGGEPIAASVTLADGSGRSIVFEADEEGRFVGTLPSEGPWEAVIRRRHPNVFRRLQDVEVKRLSPGRPARISLDLPGTMVEGSVVDGQGKPVSGAMVVATSLVGEPPVSTISDDEGRFEFFGVPEGTTRLMAEVESRPALRSDYVAVEMVDRLAPPPLRLVVKPVRELHGRVTSETGPVAGATVMVSPVGEAYYLLDPTVTNALGEFTTTVLGEAQQVQAVVKAPGFGLEIVHARVDDSAVLDLRVVAQGGSIRVDLPERLQEARWGGRQVVLVRNGGFINAALLADWRPFNDAVDSGPGFVMPQLAPGEWMVCLLDSPQIIALAAAGSRGGRCAGGYVAVGGELRLKLPLDD